MKKNLCLKSASAVLAIVILFSSCASSTIISSSPAGAKVFIDGEHVGTTPYMYTDTKIVGSKINVDIVKEGYEPIYAAFTRTEEADAGAIIGGFFVWPVWLWSMKYKPTRNYQLVPIEALQQNYEVNNPQIEEPRMLGSKIERLKELRDMLDQKLITEQEYTKEKQKILDEK